MYFLPRAMNMEAQFLHAQPRKLNANILKPILRAYALGYLTVTGPKLIAFLHVIRRKDLNNEEKLNRLFKILSRPFRWNRFPTFCALLAGGSTLLPAVFEPLFTRITRTWTKGKGRARPAITQSLLRTIRFLAALLSGWICFPIINSNGEVPPSAATSRSEEEAAIASKANRRNQRKAPEPPGLAGKTLDLSLFAVIRATDAVACMAWERWRKRREARRKWTYAESISPRLADAGVFATSSAIIMWAWFYLPERLPAPYRRWIEDAAQIDNRLIEALRSARRTEWEYGKPSENKPPLQSMCDDYNLPREWGDPEKTIPFPCELVHMGCGPSCEKHALWRFAKAFHFACATYLPIHLALRWRSRSVTVFANAVKNALRSSAFLSCFISIFYYSVCLARTRLGPRLFSPKLVTPMMWDSGLCVAAGCMMCGWSILVENAKKRLELALFVAPRAAVTLLPRRYDKKDQWREQAAFSVSTAILITAIQERPEMIRGVFGRVLAQIFNH
ncbi:integral membrane protein [Histoplasma ohiense]|nr:integral membrane protein [Histoplasma ohiense (nom. inval.)]